MLYFTPMNTGSTVYLIPVPVADGALHTLSQEIYTCTAQVRHYFVENVRTARRLLKALHPSIVIDSLHFSIIDKHQGADLRLFREWLREGISIGIMSESGCPGIADPGADLVAIAHKNSATVIPLTGPSSLILALMASGLNGQGFSFHGYLPVKEPHRSRKIRQLAQVSADTGYTQLFIETPYRNHTLLQELLRLCHDRTLLCVAQDITAPNAFIQTQPIEVWKKKSPVLEKKPAVFLLLAVI